MQLALQAILVSPKFSSGWNSTIEPDSDGRPSTWTSINWRHGCRISSGRSMPDDELFDLAAKKQLNANLDAQVKRMSKTRSRSRSSTISSCSGCSCATSTTCSRTPKLFPDFQRAAAAAMLKETELFFARDRPGRPQHSRHHRRRLHLSQPARWPGITASATPTATRRPERDEGRRQAIPRTTNSNASLCKAACAAALLTQASVLTVTSNPTRTSPVKRGRWVLEQLLGTPPPPPPPNVPELPADNKADAERFAAPAHGAASGQRACANCHAKMDPIGFAFENFNAVGAFRNKDGEFPIDPSGTLPDGKSFKAPRN